MKTTKALNNLLKSIIRDYGKPSDNHYKVNINELNSAEKKLLLSHIVDADEYEYACSSQTRLEALYKEYWNHIWNLIDIESYEVFASDMEEKGMVQVRHLNNDEVTYMRRGV